MGMEISCESTVIQTQTTRHSIAEKHMKNLML